MKKLVKFVAIVIATVVVSGNAVAWSVTGLTRTSVTIIAGNNDVSGYITTLAITKQGESSYKWEELRTRTWGKYVTFSGLDPNTTYEVYTTTPLWIMNILKQSVHSQRFKV